VAYLAGVGCSNGLLPARGAAIKGGLVMTNIIHGQTIESDLIADIAGYVPASAVLTRGQRQEARYKLRASLRKVTSLKRLHSCGLPLGGDMIVRLKNGVYHYAHELRNEM
jgi:hypothetical protein